MKTIARLALFVGSALSLAGCNLYSDGYSPVADAPPLTYSDPSVDITLRVGTAITILPSFSQDEIEGGPTVLPNGLTTDDPAIVSLTLTDHLYEVSQGQSEKAFVVTGVSEGYTTLHYTEHSDDGSITVHVIGVGQ